MGTRTTQALTRCFEGSWLLAAGAAAAVGLLVAVRTSGAPAVASVFVSTACITVMMVVAGWITDREWPVRPIMVTGGVCGSVLVVTMGLHRALGQMSFVLVAFLLLSSPYTWDLVRRGSRRSATRSGPATTRDAVDRSPKPAPHPLPDDPAFTVPDQMSVADVCQAWRSSYVALERATTPESRLCVVKMRAIYLDELERRAKTGMQAWLRSSPRAAGDPSRWVAAAKVNDLLRVVLH